MATPQNKRLKKARKTRSRMSAELRRLSDVNRDDHIDLDDALASPGSFLGLSRCRVYDVLRRAPHLGDKGAKRVLLQSKVWPLTRLGELQPVELEEIKRNLPGRAK